MKDPIEKGKYACGCPWQGKVPPKCPVHGKPKNEVVQAIHEVTGMVERLKRRNLTAIRTSSEYRR